MLSSFYIFFSLIFLYRALTSFVASLNWEYFTHNLSYLDIFSTLKKFLRLHCVICYKKNFRKLDIKSTRQKIRQNPTNDQRKDKIERQGAVSFTAPKVLNISVLIQIIIFFNAFHPSFTNKYAKYESNNNPKRKCYNLENFMFQLCFVAERFHVEVEDVKLWDNLFRELSKDSRWISISIDIIFNEKIFFEYILTSLQQTFSTSKWIYWTWIM